MSYEVLFSDTAREDFSQLSANSQVTLLSASASKPCWSVTLPALWATITCYPLQSRRLSCGIFRLTPPMFFSDGIR